MGTKIREDELSGFSSLDETMPDDGQDLFGDEEGAEGNGTTQQDPFSADEWNESEHPRKDNGQFGEGEGAFVNKKTSSRQKRAKSRERKPIRMSDYEKAVLHEAIAQNLFNDEEKKLGFAYRNTSQYKYWVRIEDAELLSYTPIRRWKNK